MTLKKRASTILATENSIDNRISSGKLSSGTENHILNNLKVDETFREHNDVLKHWFLLERDMVEAIQKRNTSLISVPMWVKFLKEVVGPKLLEEGVKGEEDALWCIHRFLHNNGWQERVRNLVSMHLLRRQNENTQLMNL